MVEHGARAGGSPSERTAVSVNLAMERMLRGCNGKARGRTISLKRHFAVDEARGNSYPLRCRWQRQLRADAQCDVRKESIRTSIQKPIHSINQKTSISSSPPPGAGRWRSRSACEVHGGREGGYTGATVNGRMMGS